jgi:hypothetical protein
VRGLPGRRAQVGTAWNPILLAPILQLFFTGLNCMWSVSLFGKLLAPKRGKAQQASQQHHDATRQKWL